MMQPLSILVGVVVLGLCVAGIRAQCFRDNWPQHFGLWAVAFAAIATLAHLITNGVLSARETLLLFGAALYGLGTAAKVRRHRGSLR